MIRAEIEEESPEWSLQFLLSHILYIVAAIHIFVSKLIAVFLFKAARDQSIKRFQLLKTTPVLPMELKAPLQT